MIVCHQVPTVLQVIHQLGLFYVWHLFQMIPVARDVCHIAH